MKLLILDIDETLIHATEVPSNKLWDFRVAQYYVYKRPYLTEFLDYCESNFEVGVWTTAGGDFARIVISRIFRKNYPLKFLWSIERCTKIFNPELHEFSYIKNLKKLKRMGYRLEEVIMIDDTPSKLRKNYGNLIAIDEFCAQENDFELLRIMKYLEDLKSVPNIRTIEKRGWKKNYKV
ncbi:hypothetical protein TI05_06405 [Achromatium sp. WMS3]|nr:hypothetical protein TI05_06405 [Achromatium sp. WMS3]